MDPENPRLNPFVYISETDIRFYLLIFIAILVPVLWAVIIGIIIISSEVGLDITLPVKLVFFLSLILFLPLVLFWLYRRSPGQVIRKSGMKAVGPDKYPEQVACITEIRKPLGIAAKPVLMYNPDKAHLFDSPFTFGTSDNPFIYLSAGLVTSFRKNVRNFRAVILHEFGHIYNRDIGKAYLANAAWRVLLYLLAIPLGVFILVEAYNIFMMFYLGYILQYSIDYIFSQSKAVPMIIVLGGIILYFLLFLGVIYILRNQIIRLREFYADARALEWDGSPRNLIDVLQEQPARAPTSVEILSRFHPDSRERVEALNENLLLFTPGLWVAFSVGFFFGIAEFTISVFSEILSIPAGEWNTMKNGIVSVATDPGVGLRAAVAIVVFTIGMAAVSSSFHRSVLRDLFIRKDRFFSLATLKAAVLYTLVFSLGFFSYYLMALPMGFSVSEAGTLADDIMTAFSKFFVIAGIFFLTLLFLLVSASLLIRRSFSEKTATRNFYFITLLASALFIINIYYAGEILQNPYLKYVFFLVFCGAMFLYIRFSDRTLHCPDCETKLPAQHDPGARCPNCNRKLFSWAVSDPV